MSDIVNWDVLWVKVRPVDTPKLDVSVIQVETSVAGTDQFAKYKAFL